MGFEKKKNSLVNNKNTMQGSNCMGNIVILDILD